MRRAGVFFGGIGITAAMALLLSAAYLRIRYPGFSRFLLNQARFATLRESRNLWFNLGYWLGLIQKIRLDPATGTYNFQLTPTDGLSDYEKGRIEYHRGAFRNALSLFKSAIRTQGESEYRLFWLALTYMRLAENENCLPMLRGEEHLEHVPDSMGMCSLPVTIFHRKTESAQAATATFQVLLDRYDPTNRLYQWLLNFNYMALGRFPEGVPEKYRIRTPFIDRFYGEAKARAQAEFTDVTFEDQAKQLGVNTFHTGRGVGVEDFDGDGYLDLVVGGSYEPVHFYHNDGGRGFVDRTAESGLAGVSQVFAIVPVDYDNDGHMDLFIGRPFSHYVLYRNNGNGTFTDVTASSGLLDGWNAEKIGATWVPAFADVNNDGKLDLFLAQWAMKIPFSTGIMARGREDSKLYIQENGRFVDRTREYGLSDIVADNFFIGAAFGDYDADGFADLFLASPLRNTSRLLHNVNGKRFEATELVRRPAGAFTAAFVDINHDGRLDIFEAGFGDAKSAVEQAVFGEHPDSHTGRGAILLQTPDGRFESHEEAFDMPIGTMGASFGDINNDGCYDFYFGKGTPEPWFVLPNLMYLGKSDGTRCKIEFSNVSMLEGLGNLQKGHGIVFFDFNNDGRQDIYSALGGMWPGDAWTAQLFVNRSRSANTWTKIRLRGRKTNYFGVGATIRVRAENRDGQEIVRYYQMNNKTGFGGAPLLAHIGLMNAVRIKDVEVFWPASRCRALYKAELEQLNLLDEAACTQSTEARFDSHSWIR
jgi:FG-GAP-like repeat/ASPIC and UnbV/FG-GAP repeat